jgi:hypothetical protein
MKRLDDIPEKEFSKHKEAGTLGNSEQITEEELSTYDNQIKRHGLELVVFKRGKEFHWFAQSRGPHLDSANLTTQSEPDQ